MHQKASTAYFKYLAGPQFELCSALSLLFYISRKGVLHYYYSRSTNTTGILVVRLCSIHIVELEQLIAQEEGIKERNAIRN